MSDDVPSVNKNSGFQDDFYLALKMFLSDLEIVSASSKLASEAKTQKVVSFAATIVLFAKIFNQIPDKKFMAKTWELFKKVDIGFIFDFTFILLASGSNRFIRFTA